MSLLSSWGTRVCRVAAILAVAVFSGGALAAPNLEKPIYNEDTKSYFEMIDHRSVTGWSGLRWEEAVKKAEKRTLGGVKGRLAIIASPQTELFLKVNLRPDSATWFGLYYDCASSTFNWIDGTMLTGSDYGNFDVQNWYRSGGLCAPHRKWSKYPGYLDMGVDNKWAIKAPEKLYYYYIVEYPTGGPVDALKSEAPIAVPKATDAPMPTIDAEGMTE